MALQWYDFDWIIDSFLPYDLNSAMLHGMIYICFDF